MGRGSSGTKNQLNQKRRFYTFTLNTEDASDTELIEYLENRSTTATVKEALRQMMHKQQNSVTFNEDMLQLMAMVMSNATNNGESLTTLLEKMNQTKNDSRFTEEEEERIDRGVKKAESALFNLNF
ncbi:hypothetical protein [Bacillus massiliigorillae]|uniref:hypothetical protein n=1 Tax=Bacillus massiliigorillae TaxID=1243664 RepID=UPI0003AB1A7C|nr:hypothetical protein [Bacillus massiliigorillae]